MVNIFLNEVINCLDNECYLSALSDAMVLIDMCTVAEFPDSKTNGNHGKRYIEWVDTYLIPHIEVFHFSSASDELPTPYLNGEILYSLRCCLLHNGTPNIESKKLKDENNVVEQFEIIVEKTKEFNIYIQEYATYEDAKHFDGKYVVNPDETDLNKHLHKHISLNVQKFCRDVCCIVKKYYSDNQSLFSFNCKIRNKDEEMEYMNTYVYK